MHSKRVLSLVLRKKLTEYLYNTSYKNSTFLNERSERKNWAYAFFSARLFEYIGLQSIKTLASLAFFLQILRPM